MEANPTRTTKDGWPLMLFEEMGFLLRRYRCREALEVWLAWEEGFMADPYKDSRGFWTVGFGHLLSRGEPVTMLPEWAGLVFLKRDKARAVSDMQSVFPNIHLDPARRVALQSMAFQLGRFNLCGFKKMKRAVMDGAWRVAKAEALESEWAHQTPARAHRTACIIGEGMGYFS